MRRRLRLVLALLLTLALDAAIPVGPEAFEALEGLEDAAHGARARRSVTAARREQPREGPRLERPQVARPRVARIHAVRRPVHVGVVPEPLPGSVESPAAPEDH